MIISKAPVPPNERCCSVPGAVKKVHHRSLLFNKRWPPLRKRRGRLGPLGQRRNLERWTTAALPGR